MKSVKIYIDNLEILHDIGFAISCTQDYRDTIDITTPNGIKEYDNVTERIGRLFNFYNQLIGFEQIKPDDSEISTIELTSSDRYAIAGIAHILKRLKVYPEQLTRTKQDDIDLLHKIAGTD
jgi:hypothetical protein